MIKTKMCELLGVKHPIIQAGMGPFSNNKLSIAALSSCAHMQKNVAGRQPKHWQTTLQLQCIMYTKERPGSMTVQMIIRRITDQLTGKERDTVESWIIDSGLESCFLH